MICPNRCEEFFALAAVSTISDDGGFCPGCGSALIPDVPEAEAIVNGLREAPDADVAGQAAAWLAAQDDAALYPGIRVPDRIGEVIGWRAWKIVTLGKLIRLQSVTHSAHWPATDWVYAECSGASYATGMDPKLRSCPSADDGRCPGETCTCGLYAGASPEQLDDLAYNRRYSDGSTIVGQVAMSGKIVAGTQGWRAEKARVYRLYCPWDRDVGQALANQYRVPVELRRVTDLSDLYDQD